VGRRLVKTAQRDGDKQRCERRIRQDHGQVDAVATQDSLETGHDSFTSFANAC
jgi:hypothetical protein